jgi:hypothetical protein
MGKGRDKSLIDKRNDALLRRYHYWTEKERLRFDDALKVLSEKEFFISEERIMSIVREHGHKIPELNVAPVPKVKKPHLTAMQLSLFAMEV